MVRYLIILGAMICLIGCSVPAFAEDDKSAVYYIESSSPMETLIFKQISNKCSIAANEITKESFTSCINNIVRAEELPSYGAMPQKIKDAFNIMKDSSKTNMEILAILEAGRVSGFALGNGPSEKASEHARTIMNAADQLALWLLEARR